MDYSKLSKFKPSVEKLYNLKAKEEKKIIYACHIPSNPLLTEEEKQKEKEELERQNRESNLRCFIINNSKSKRLLY